MSENETTMVLRDQLRVMLRRLRRLARTRTVTVEAGGAQLLVDRSTTDAAIDDFAGAAPAGFVHVTNLGFASDPSRIRWSTLRYASVRRILHTMTGLFCCVLPASETKNSLYRRLGFRIGRNVEISQGAFLDPFCPALVSIGDHTVIGAFAKIFTHAYRGQGRMLFGPVTIGEGCVISGTATLGPCLLESDVTVLPGVVAMTFLRLRAGAIFGVRSHLDYAKREAER